MTNEAKKMDRTAAMFCHLSALSAFLIPFGHILGPVIVWLAKKDDDALVDEHGRLAINFQISVSIYFSILILLLIGSIAVTGFYNIVHEPNAVRALGSFIGEIVFLFLICLALGGLWLMDLILVIMNSVRAYDGKSVMYPLSLPLLHVKS